MSATNFYQTLYQNDQLFRLPGEAWDSGSERSRETPASKEEIPLTESIDAHPSSDSLDLLAELDALAATPAKSRVQLIQEPIVVPDSPVVIAPETAVVSDPEPIALVSTPEPLPQQVPRPSTPSVIPPIHQPRMPQLNHKVLLLADEELDPSNLLFLEKILKAVNLNIDGVDLLNLNGARDLDFAELVQDKKIHHFITFGVPFNRIHLDIAMDRYQPIRFFGITFLMADSLPTIEADHNLKKRLWGALQRIFLQR